MKQLYLVLTFAMAISSDCLGAEKAAKPKAKNVVVQEADIGASVTVMGRLGVPVGTRVTVRGKKVSGPKSPAVFRIETVNGKKLAKTVGMTAGAIKSWPDGTEATICGHERGTIMTTAPQGPCDAPDGDEPIQVIYFEFFPDEIIEGGPPEK